MKYVYILYFVGLLNCSVQGFDPEVLQQYVMALFDTHAENYESAQRRYASLPKDKPLDIYKGYIQLLNILKQYDVILSLMPLFEESFRKQARMS